jgi:hypothetical protein
MPGSPTRLAMPLGQKGNTEVNNGYVVFKCNLHVSSGKYGGGGKALLRPLPPPPPPRNRFRQAGSRFLGSLKGLQIRAQASEQISKADVNGFSSSSDICFMLQTN